MDDTQRIVKCGNLSLHSPGGFFKKRWHTKYLVLYDGSKSGVKRLELFDSELKFKKQDPAKIIPLIDCVRIVTCQRHKTTFTFEVRTNEQFYLLGSQSFQDMNDWVNCLRLVAFGQTASSSNAAFNGTAPSSALPAAAAAAASSSSTRTIAATPVAASEALAAASAAQAKRATATAPAPEQAQQQVDVLLQETVRRQTPNEPHTKFSAGSSAAATQANGISASQAAAAAASALAKTRQRQPSLLGSCKPLPPDDSPFIQCPSAATVAARAPQSAGSATLLNSIGQLDTLTPTVRGQLIATACSQVAARSSSASSSLVPSTRAAPEHQLIANKCAGQSAPAARQQQQQVQVPATLDEEEENMLYCSIEDNPSEHNYRVKVLETELAVRCQLKCYQLSGPSVVCEQYEELSQFRGRQQQKVGDGSLGGAHPPVVTFYQLIIGPQELTLLNDYATFSQLQAKASNQQGLWSWPYQCIRRYGFDKDNCFMFEAGRKCASGPGQFVVQTPKAYNIYQDVVRFVNELRTVTGGQEQQPTAPPPSAEPLQKAADENCRPTSKSVTQIPVIWTPEQHSAAAIVQPNNEKLKSMKMVVSSSSNDHGDSGAGSPREQFFNALNKQLDPSGQLAQQNGTSAAKTLRAKFHESHESPVSGCSLTMAPSSSCASSTTSSSSSDQENPNLMARARSTPQLAGRAPRGTNPIGNNNGPSLASGSDETDESGYEQGDDQQSTDGGTSRMARQTTNAASEGAQQTQQSHLARTRRQQVVEHQSTGSNACLITKSESHAPDIRQVVVSNKPKRQIEIGSGGSVADRVRALGLHDLLVGGDNDTARTGPSSNKMKTSESNSQAPLSNKLSVVQQQRQSHDDFEANLIRDVYCEITKLHAKFAVTTNGSGDDSLSSRSSTGSSTGDSMTTSRDSSVGTMSLDNRLTQDGGDLGDVDDDYEDDERLAKGQISREPMYSNVEADLGLGKKGNKLAYQERISNIQRQTLSNRQISQARQLSSVDSNCGNQHARRLNNQHPQSVQNKIQNDQHARTNVLNNNNTLSFKRTDNFNDHNLYLQAASRHHYPTLLNPILESHDDEQSNMNAINNNNHLDISGKRLSSPTAKKPTNHYVINDVQYAKISRNFLR